MPRPERKPLEIIRREKFDFLTDVHELLTKAKRAKGGEEGDLSPQRLIQLIKDQGQISDEMEVVLPQAPAHDSIRPEADKWARNLAALRRHRQLNSSAMTKRPRHNQGRHMIY